MPWGRWHWLVCLALGISWVLDGLEVTTVGIIGDTLKKQCTHRSASTPAAFVVADMYLRGGDCLCLMCDERSGLGHLFAAGGHHRYSVHSGSRLRLTCVRFVGRYVGSFIQSFAGRAAQERFCRVVRRQVRTKEVLRGDAGHHPVLQLRHRLFVGLLQLPRLQFLHRHWHRCATPWPAKSRSSDLTRRLIFNVAGDMQAANTAR